jgi:hypothetical protein
MTEEPTPVPTVVSPNGVPEAVPPPSDTLNPPAYEKISEDDSPYFTKVVTNVKAASDEYRQAEEFFNNAQAKLLRAQGAWESVMEVLVEKYELDPSKDRIDEHGNIMRDTRSQ